MSENIKYMRSWVSVDPENANQVMGKAVSEIKRDIESRGGSGFKIRHVSLGQDKSFGPRAIRGMVIAERV